MKSLEQCEEQGKKYMSSKRGSKNNSAYVATKFAINGLTQSLSKELGSNTDFASIFSERSLFNTFCFSSLSGKIINRWNI